MTRTEIHELINAEVVAWTLEAGQVPAEITVGPRLWGAMVDAKMVQHGLLGAWRDHVIRLDSTLEPMEVRPHLARESFLGTAMNSILKDVYLSGIRKQLNDSTPLWRTLTKRGHK